MAAYLNQWPEHCGRENLQVLCVVRHLLDDKCAFAIAVREAIEPIVKLRFACGSLL